MNLLDNITTNASLFKTKVKNIKKIRKPSIVVFITPNLSIFDIIRLIKLSNFNKENFFIKIIIKPSMNKTVNDKFKEIIDKFIPSNKEIFNYEDIVKDFIFNRDFLSLQLNYKLKDFYILLKKSKIDLSLLDIQRLITQYFVLKNTQPLIGGNNDFYISTVYENIFFNSSKVFNTKKIPMTLIIGDVPLKWTFLESFSELESEIRQKLSNKEEIKLNTTLSNFLNTSKELTLLDNLKKIKYFLNMKSDLIEIHPSREHYTKFIYLLNNEIRRKLIGLIANYKSIKAEDLRSIINKKRDKKLTLSNILKHLNLLHEHGIISKEKRYYSLRYEKICLNITLRWLNEEDSNWLQ
jgi:hypothetical protein